MMIFPCKNLVKKIVRKREEVWDEVLLVTRWPKILKSLYDFRATNKQRMFFSIPEIAILTTPEIFC